MRTDRSSFVFLILLTLIAAGIPVAAHAADSSGTDYWVAFPRNVPPEHHVYLMISSRVATSGLVSNASLGINIAFDVVPGTTTVIDLPFTTILNANDTIEDKGVHVTALAPIVVYGSNLRVLSADAYLALPVDAIGTNYMVMAWDVGLGVGTELTVVATQNDTNVTITPTASAGSRTAGVPFVLTMQQGQTYTLYASGGADFTGSTIVSDKPVGVYGGHSCGNVPDADTDFCDYLIEQMFPVSTFGTSFITMPYAARTSGYIVRVLASQDDTAVSFNGVVVATIDAGQFYEASLLFGTQITTTRPVSVAQYAKGQESDDLTGDPHEMLILPNSNFLSSYLVATSAAALDEDYLNIIAPTYSVGTVTVDGISVAAEFDPIATSGYSGAQIAIGPGDHTVDAAAPIGVYVYGFDGSAGSYGYPGGALTAPLSTNLSIQKTAGAGPVLVSGPVTYTIVVSNSGPDTAVGAMVSDDFPAALTNVNWTCTPSAGATCTAAGAGDLQDFVTIPAGGSVTYNVTATAPAAPANISNTATVTAAGNAADPAPANNSSTADFPVLPAPVAPLNAVPTLGEWALILFGAAMSLAGVLATRRV
ncbi:MAG TPA: IPTL-CTERM sorting domain-containing protein [Thermoanaerobaculia bacterium]